MIKEMIRNDELKIRTSRREKSFLGNYEEMPEETEKLEDWLASASKKKQSFKNDIIHENPERTGRFKNI